MPRSEETDIRFMMVALGLARRGLGRVAPNPAVGCVIVADEHIVGRGWTSPGGRPHAETSALAQAGSASRGATAYVTLEPCAHQGQTGPCAEALVAAGISKVVVAAGDPDPRVAGKGVAILERAGILVVTDVCHRQAMDLNEGFMKKVNATSPMVTLKLATSLDGKIATASGEAKWITGEAARARGHMLRASHDAILTGIGTVLADDPSLTSRYGGLEDQSPVRVVMDHHLRLPLESTLAQTAHKVPVLVFALPGADGQKKVALAERGVEVISLDPGTNGRILAKNVLSVLAQRGLTRVLVEAGAMLNAAFVEADLVDHIAWFRAPVVIGGAGLSALAGMELSSLAVVPKYVRKNIFHLGRIYWKLTLEIIKYRRMFTGIITDVGKVRGIERRGDTRFEIETVFDTSTIEIGASIACSGVCLTAVDKGDDWFAVDVSAETLSKTTLGEWAEGTPVNLERSLRVGDEMGGHIVSGHVDGVGKIVDIQLEGDSRRFSFEVSDKIGRYIAPKGSVALNGVSLTVNEVEDPASDKTVFGVNIIPHTQIATSFRDVVAGDRVNVEIDVLARYVARMAEKD